PAPPPRNPAPPGPPFNASSGHPTPATAFAGPPPPPGGPIRNPPSLPRAPLLQKLGSAVFGAPTPPAPPSATDAPEPPPPSWVVFIHPGCPAPAPNPRSASPPWPPYCGASLLPHRPAMRSRKCSHGLSP